MSKKFPQSSRKSSRNQHPTKQSSRNNTRIEPDDQPGSVLATRAGELCRRWVNHVPQIAKDSTNALPKPWWGNRPSTCLEMACTDNEERRDTTRRGKVTASDCGVCVVCARMFILVFATIKCTSTIVADNTRTSQQRRRPANFGRTTRNMLPRPRSPAPQALLGGAAFRTRKENRRRRIV